MVILFLSIDINEFIVQIMTYLGYLINTIKTIKTINIIGQVKNNPVR
ncbi:hypothetical protein BML2526_12330 [Providencia rettgeri]|nr:hypothetical protein BML2526_12330 [Providencia rettgeri]BBV02273.1 hypothetical protein BML2531_00490 [Providencia rettgeri]BBV10659.1 hypothetical protein BML2576_01180 [Providencia rettgeri]BDH16782.1 hypothetical protein PrNR1418_00730 [Providencia rettgeri]